MFTILLHSSKTMRVPPNFKNGSTPAAMARAQELVRYVSGLGTPVIAKAMGISPDLAARVSGLFTDWHDGGAPAIDSFVGDIYSGLQGATLSTVDREYANRCLVILSGLYGVLRPLDAVRPYRLEMAYKFPDAPYNNLYRFWGDSLARALPTGRTIINTSSVEYTKAIFPYLEDARIITPKFFSVSPKTGQPTFVTVHTKIARGAFARWMIVNRVEDEARLADFNELGYAYDTSRSTELEPAYIAKNFGGLGMSVRLS